MADPKVQRYDAYLAAWSAITDAERLGLLQDSLSETAVFSNPTQTRRGLPDIVKHLEGFQVRSPGGSFRMNNMIGWGDSAMAEWQLVHGSDEPGFSGYDILTFDEEGLIDLILLFGSVEARKLAWRRRRDPVSLEPTE